MNGMNTTRDASSTDELVVHANKCLHVLVNHGLWVREAPMATPATCWPSRRSAPRKLLAMLAVPLRAGLQCPTPPCGTGTTMCTSSAPDPPAASISCGCGRTLWESNPEQLTPSRQQRPSHQCSRSAAAHEATASAVTPRLLACVMTPRVSALMCCPYHHGAGCCNLWRTRLRTRRT